ncbi:MULTISPECIES: hypothetical protein [unclassified Brevundimonas]|uniref:hypothetical protein n=1 Tax=unclassified Brevundimonas TaxID=2622653 RepID=UPI00142F9CD8|nr:MULTISPECIES: hypothetical protein [unclassified Brevundimonas]
MTGRGRAVLADAVGVWIALHETIERELEGAAPTLRSGLAALTRTQRGGQAALAMT